MDPNHLSPSLNSSHRKINSQEKLLSYEKAQQEQIRKDLRKIDNEEQHNILSNQKNENFNLDRNMKKSIQKLIQTENDCFKIFEDFINQKEKWPKDSNPERIYYLIEDIAILFFVGQSEIEQLGTKFWDLLVQNKVFVRSPESLRDRYKRYLSQLRQADLMKIANYLLDYGVNGYLRFYKDYHGKKKLDNITPIDKEEFEMAQQQKIKKSLAKKSAQKQIYNDDINMRQDLQPEKRKLYKSKHLYQRKYQDENYPYDQNLEHSQYKNYKKIKQNPDHPHRSVLKDQDNLPEINKKIIWFEKNFNISKQQVLDELTNVSGNWNDLLDVMKGENKHLKWKKAEDQILQKVQDENEPKFQKLLSLKGEKNVLQRLNFLNISKDFL